MYKKNRMKRVRRSVGQTRPVEKRMKRMLKMKKS